MIVQSIFVSKCIAIISWKSAHGQSTLLVSQSGGWVLFYVFLHLIDNTRVPMSRSQQLDALEANNWTSK